MSDVLDFLIELLTNIANDLDQMLAELCTTYPKKRPPACPKAKLVRSSDTRITRSEVKITRSSPTKAVARSEKRWQPMTQSLSTFGKQRGRMARDEDAESNDENDEACTCGTNGMHHALLHTPVRGRPTLHTAHIRQLPPEEHSSESPPLLDSPPRQLMEDPPPIPMLERLIRTQTIWFQPNISRMATIHLLQNREEGLFVVRKSSRKNVMALSLRVGSKPTVDHYLIESRARGLRLEGSYHHFSAIPVLIAYYCENLDELPCKLVLPQPLMQASSHQELTSYGLLGPDFWTAPVVNRSVSTQQVNVTSRSTTQGVQHTSIGGGTRIPIKSYRSGAPQTHTPVSMDPVAEPISNGNIVTELVPMTTIHRPFGVSRNSHMTQNVSSFQSKRQSQSSPFESLGSFAQQNTAKPMSTFKTVIDIAVCEPPKATVKPTHIDLESPNYDNVFDTTDSGFNTGSKIVVPKPRRLSPKNQVQASQVTSGAKLEYHVEFPPDDKRGSPSPYYGGRLSDKLSDYEDIWNTSPPKVNLSSSPDKFCLKNKHVESNVVHLNIERVELRKPSVSSQGSQNRLSILNPGYKSDSDSEKGQSPAPVISRESEERIIDVTQDSSVSSRVQSEQCVVSDCGYTSQSSMYSNQPEVIASVIIPPVQRREMPQNRFTPHRRSAFSPVKSSAKGDVILKAGPSPGYREPVDSLLWKTSSEQCESGAVNAKESVRRDMAKRASDGALIGDSSHVISHTYSDSNLPNKVQVEGINFKTKISHLKQTVETIHSPRLKSRKSGAHGPRCRSLDPPRQRVDSVQSVAVTQETKNKRSLSLECLLDKSESPVEIPIEYIVTSPEEQNVSIKHVTPQKPPSGYKGKQEATSLNNNESSVTSPNRNCPSKSEIKLSQSFQNNFFSPKKSPDRNIPTPLRRFPMYHSQSSVASNCSEASTVEDIISSLTPELKVHPIRPLTIANVQRMSEYDNLGHLAGSTSKAPSSVGTYYCKPWDSSAWQDIFQSKTVKLSESEKKETQGNMSTVKSGKYENVTDDEAEAASFADYSFVHTTEEKASASKPNLATELSTSIEWRLSLQTEGRDSDDGEGSVDDDVVARVTEHMDVSDSEEDQRSTRELLGDKLVPFLGSTKVFISHQNTGLNLREHLYGLAKDNHSTFGATVDHFIRCTKEGSESNPHIVMRNVRQFMSGIKNYLVQNNEGKITEIIQEERKKLGTNEFLNVDAIIESVLHKIIIKPLKKHIYKLFVQEYRRRGNLKLLSDSIKLARSKSLQELGVRRGIRPPQGSSMELIKQFLVRMQKAFSPLHKLENLLAAMSTIFNSVQVSSGSGKEFGNLGTDDLQPLLVYVLVQCGLVSAEIEADYIWGLLHPCMLAGEGGYYLTTLSSAVHVIKNMRALEQTKGSDKQLLRTMSMSGLQGFLRILVPEEQSAHICTQTLPLRPNMTTKDICNMMAHKFKITNPQDYGLYLLVDGSEERLGDNECPQDKKLESTAKGHHCSIAYKRCDAKFVWPVNLS